jgi:hypothetical protein
MVQRLFLQVVVATCLVQSSTVHIAPQAPQLLGSPAVWVSQPSAVTLLQFWYLTHRAVAGGGGGGSTFWQGLLCISTLKGE